MIAWLDIRGKFSIKTGKVFLFRTAVQMGVLSVLLVFFRDSAGAALITARWVGTGDGNWSDAARWEGGRVPNNGNGEEFEVWISDSRGAVTADVPVTIGVLHYRGGRLNIRTGLAMREFYWERGMLAGPGAVQVAERAVISGSGAATPHELEECLLELGGVTELSTRIDIAARAPNAAKFRFLKNRGTFRALRDATIYTGDSPGSTEIFNSGSFW